MTEDKVLEVTRRFVRDRGGQSDEITVDDAICQDLMIFGIDVEEYVGELEEEFGEVVWTIPWLHYTDQTSSFRGCGCLLFPPWLIGQMGRKAVRGGPLIPPPNPKSFPRRLTLKEIADAIDTGGWSKEEDPN